MLSCRVASKTFSETLLAQFWIKFCIILEAVGVPSAGIALILGGALGNVLDRVLMVLLPSQYSGVVDFIDVGIGTIRW